MSASTMKQQQVLGDLAVMYLVKMRVFPKHLSTQLNDVSFVRDGSHSVHVHQSHVLSSVPQGVALKFSNIQFQLHVTSRNATQINRP